MAKQLYMVEIQGRPLGGYDRKWDLQINEGSFQALGIAPMVIPMRFSGHSHCTLRWIVSHETIKEITEFANALKEKKFLDSIVCCSYKIDMEDTV